MRKKLDTRFPAARIKKIMQADEDVGKIAMAVPLLVSKALELFLQDLCDRTYEVTLQRGAKTLNSMHLKQCVQRFNVFDFLRDIVGKVPDLGGSDAAGEDRSAAKRRKVADDDHNDGDGDSKSDKPQLEPLHVNGSGPGRGRGRGRGRIRRAERESHLAATSSHDSDSANKQKAIIDSIEDTDSKGNHITGTVKTEGTVKVRNFDLNLDLDENGDTPLVSPAPVIPADPPPPPEYPGWSLAEVEKMAIDPVRLANLNSGVDDNEEG